MDASDVTVEIAPLDPHEYEGKLVARLAKLGRLMLEERSDPNEEVVVMAIIRRRTPDWQIARDDERLRKVLEGFLQNERHGFVSVVNAEGVQRACYVD